MADIKPEQIIKIKLDLVEGWKNKRNIEIKQSDNDTRYLLIRLTNLLPMNITGYQPTLVVKRADGVVLSTLCQATQADKGEFIVALSNSILKTQGAISFEVVLVKDDAKILSFPQFTMQIVESLHDEVDFEPADDDLQILWDVIAKMQTATTKFDSDYQEFKTGVESDYQSFKESKTNEFQSFITEKDNQFQTSETSRQSQELVRQQAENTRQQGYVEMQDTVQEIYSTTLKYRIVE